MPAVLAGYFLLGRLRLTLAARLYLLAASLFFYAYWNPVYLVLILSSILVNYLVCLGFWRGVGRRKALLVAGLVFNLGLLGVFKYTDMAIGTANGLFGLHLPLQHLTLPLAISFFTFQQIAAVVDTYRGTTRPCALHDYALFVSFFPQLIAGPIVHYTEMVPQFRRLRAFVFSNRNVAIGAGFFLMGLFKKAIIADGIAAYVGPVFGALSYDHLPSFIEAWGGTLAYTFQVYFDFSGYTDMAIGLGRMFNIRLPLNFDSPYKSRSIREFWRRWHITLSRFLRDYLYIPLGGSRCSFPRRLFNVMATMLLGGLWHGANWTLVLWGAFHGAMLWIQLLWSKLHRPLPGPVAWAVTFTGLAFSMVLVRAPDLATTMAVWKGMLGFNGFALPLKLLHKWGPVAAWLADHGVTFTTLAPYWRRSKEIQHLAACLVLVLAFPNSQEIFARYFRPSRLWAFAYAACAVVGILALTKVSEFLYFRF
nr:MBOAT family protein [Dissulfurirhabdus thermomarina]